MAFEVMSILFGLFGLLDLLVLHLVIIDLAVLAQLLVLHNFGNASVELSLTDNIEKTVGVSGTVQVKDGDDTSIRLGGYSSVVYKIAQ